MGWAGCSWVHFRLLCMPTSMRLCLPAMLAHMHSTQALAACRLPNGLQVGFKKTLLQDVKAFVVDAVGFRQDWEANGPTVPGLDPTDASDRLRKFQQLFEVRGWARAGRGGAVQFSGPGFFFYF